MLPVIGKIYVISKHTTKQLLPLKYLFRAEDLIRHIVFQFYKGEQYRCNICEKKLKSFITNKGNKACAYCGSLSSDRRLWKLLKPFLSDNAKVLHFSPSRSLIQRLKSYPGIQYFTSDFKGKVPADKQLDITRIDEPNSSYDLIICYYVLEHIVNDKKAMQEINRVLKIGGKCFIQSPFKKGMIYENPDITTPAEREKHFGGKNHVRIYSVDGLKARLQNIGFDVVSTKFTAEKDNPTGLEEEEYVVTALKY